MYVSAIAIRLLRGRSTPAMRAMPFLLALPLLVLGVLADHAHDPSSAHDHALVTHLADRRPDLHLSPHAPSEAPGLARHAREHLGLSLGDEYRVLKVRRNRAVQ